MNTYSLVGRLNEINNYECIYKYSHNVNIESCVEGYCITYDSVYVNEYRCVKLSNLFIAKNPLNHFC